jgi:hypothetical protein
MAPRAAFIVTSFLALQGTLAAVLRSSASEQLVLTANNEQHIVNAKDPFNILVMSQNEANLQMPDRDELTRTIRELLRHKGVECTGGKAPDILVYASQEAGGILMQRYYPWKSLLAACNLLKTEYTFSKETFKSVKGFDQVSCTGRGPSSAAPERICVHTLAAALQYLAVYVRKDRGITEDGKYTLNLGSAVLRNKGAIFMRLNFPGDRKLVLASAHLPMKGEDQSPWEIGLQQRKDAFKEIVDFLSGKSMFSGPKKASNWMDRTAIIFTGDTNMRIDDNVGDQLTSLMAAPEKDNPFHGWKEGGHPPDFFTCRFEKQSLFSGDALTAYTSCRRGADDYALRSPRLARWPKRCETRSG